MGTIKNQREEALMNVWDAIRTKRAVRQFTDQPLPEDAVQRILDAGRRAQSSKNSQPWDFIAVRERQRLQQLSTMGDWMGHVAGAALCVVLVTPVPAAEPAAPEDRYPWYMFDIGQAASYMQLAALEVGVGSCLGTIYKTEAVRALLGIPQDKWARIVISFGYPQPQEPRPPRPGGRRALDETVHWETW